MEPLNQRLRQETQDLKELSNELCEQIDEVREEIIEELEEAEWRWHHIENSFDRLRRRMKTPARDVVRAVDKVADEVQHTFRDIRRLWK